MVHGDRNRLDRVQANESCSFEQALVGSYMYPREQ